MSSLVEDTPESEGGEPGGSLFPGRLLALVLLGMERNSPEEVEVLEDVTAADSQGVSAFMSSSYIVSSKSSGEGGRSYSEVAATPLMSLPARERIACSEKTINIEL